VETAVIPLATMAASVSARACGVSTADGLSSCSLAEHEEETRPRWRVGASAACTSTAIDFGNNLGLGHEPGTARRREDLD